MESESDEEEGSQEDEEEPEDEVKEEFLNIKGLLYIERIKDIVGEIMSTCESKLQF